MKAAFSGGSIAHLSGVFLGHYPSVVQEDNVLTTVHAGVWSADCSHSRSLRLIGLPTEERQPKKRLSPRAILEFNMGPTRAPALRGATPSTWTRTSLRFRRSRKFAAPHRIQDCVRFIKTSPAQFAGDQMVS